VMNALHESSIYQNHLTVLQLVIPNAILDKDKQIFVNKRDDFLNKTEAVLGILTDSTLENQLFVDTLAFIHDSKKKLIMMFDNEESRFPAVIPTKLSDRKIFNEIAIQYSGAAFVEEYWKSIIKRVHRPADEHEDISTDVFLSHYQDEGQGVATTLYELLTHRKLKVFLDIRTEFVTHDLPKLVSSTKLFVFYVTKGIFSRYWCKTEFMAWYQNRDKVKILVLVDAKYRNFEVPDDWKEYYDILKSHKAFIYEAKYTNTVVENIVSILNTVEK